MFSSLFSNNVLPEGFIEMICEARPYDTSI